VFLQRLRLKSFRPLLLFFTPVPAISDLYLILRSIHFSSLIVSPLLMLLSFLDFSFVTHLTWPSHVTCDTYYIDPNPSSVCFQRQHQGELCPSSHACSNSTYNTNNIVLETEGTTGTGLLARRNILPNEIIVVFGNAIILQDRGLVQEFTKLINT